MSDKVRIDVLLVEKGLCKSREQAKALIMAGQVYVNGCRCDKAGDQVLSEVLPEIRGETLKYVSRGGLKLEKALSCFPISLENKICMDIGASTGGFTDCMLMSGAKKVYSIDVGYGQLAWKLRVDERVVNMERTNIRYVKPEDIEDTPKFASIDVSFISLGLVLPVAYNILSDDGEVVALIKPQFEAGREQVGKKGVVRDENVHMEVIEKVAEKAQDIGFSVCGLSYSPVKGPEGNIEYLIYLSKSADDCGIGKAEIEKVVRDSHDRL